MATAAAFFDFDRTLISGASAFPVGVEAWRQGLASNEDIVRWVVTAITFKLIGDRGDNSTPDIKTDFLSRIAGATVEDLNSVATAVVPRLMARVRPEARQLIAMHEEEQRDAWIVSASPAGLIQPVADSLGMTGVVATRAEVVDGRYTGQLDGPFVYGAGKVEAIESLAAERGYDLRLCYAYSDSVSDLPMLQSVGHPVAVNPDSELETIAHQRGWPVVIFARTAKRVLAVGGVGIGTIIATSAAYLLGRRHGRSSALTGVRD